MCRKFGLLNSYSRLPPEAFRGDISSAWDLWSLGIMLIEMTTNQLPYKFNNDINQLMAKVMNCELQIPSLPKEFKQIIEGCLQKDRKQRWTAQQVLNALQPVGWNSPPSPPPAPAAVKKPVSPTPFTEKLPNRVTLEMVSLPAGQFLMGSPDSDYEKPPHQVKVNSFAIGKYPVTQAQYEAVMGTNPSLRSALASFFPTFARSEPLNCAVFIYYLEVIISKNIHILPCLFCTCCTRI